MSEVKESAGVGGFEEGGCVLMQMQSSRGNAVERSENWNETRLNKSGLRDCLGVRGRVGCRGAVVGMWRWSLIAERM